MTDLHPRPDDSTADALASTLRSLYRRLKRELNRHSNTGELTPSQAAVVVRLDASGPATASALARAEGMRPQSMHAILAALGGLGLTASAPDPADGRQVLVSLSETGARWLAEGRAARQDWLTRRLAAALTEDDRADLARALSTLSRALDS